MLGVKRFEDLDVHKLAVEIRREIFTLTSGGAVARDYKFVAQIRDAARGGPRNVAEGFSRFAPAEFRHFLSYAKASIDETKDAVCDARDCQYFSEEDSERVLTLIRRVLAAISALMRYLESPAAQRAYEASLKARARRTRRKKRTKTSEPLEP